MAELKRVTLEGTHRTRAVAVTFTRLASGDWELRMVIDLERQPVIVIPKRERVTACWSAACDYLDEQFRGFQQPIAPPRTNRQKAIAKGAARGGKLALAKGTGKP